MSRPHPRRATAPVPSHSWTSRAEGGAGTSRADTPHINPAERSEVKSRGATREGRACRGRTRAKRPHPRQATVPVPSHSRTPRAEGGAGTSRADTPHINPVERFRSEIARPRTGGPRLSRPHPRRTCSDVSVAGGPRLSRPHPRRAAVPAPDYSRTSRAEGGPPRTSAPTTSPPPVRCAIRPRARRWGRDERFHVGTVPK